MSETLTAPDLTQGVQTRALPTQVRAAETEGGAREVAGIGVPWDTPISIYGMREEFAPGAVELADHATYFWRHGEPIGVLLSHQDTDAGWEFRARISATRAGDDAYTLLRDGVVTTNSIRFEPLEHIETRDETTGTVTIRHTRVRVTEVSAEPLPAYETATITEVRSRPTTPKEDTPVTDTTAADVQELRTAVEDIARTMEVIRDGAPAAPAPAETRSAGELLRAAIVDKDETALEALNRVQTRAYTGGTTGDAIVKDQWVGDLTRLVETADPLGGLFSTGPLPATGMNIEYGQLKANTIKVEEQVKEGDDLAYGKVQVETKTAPVKTYGGYTQLSVQEIERSTNHNILDTHLRAQAIEAGKRQAVVFRGAYEAAVAAQKTAKNTVTLPGESYGDWLDAVVDAAIKYEDQGLSLDALIVDPSIFKSLARLEGGDGRPMLTVSGTGANTVGSLNVKALQGDLASIPVRLNAKQTAAGAAFVNRLALRSYVSPLVRLQDENIINLSRTFSVYRYAAVANEVPAAIVPVVAPAAG